MKFVFLHGLAGSARNFKYLEKQFEGAVITFDLPGYGELVHERCKPKEYYLDYIRRKIKFNPNEKYIFLGHSMGAILAVDFALAYPKQVKKIFLVNYPMKKQEMRSQWLYGKVGEKLRLAKILCKTKHAWKGLLFLLLYPWYCKYTDSYWDYFKHYFETEEYHLNEFMLKDNKEKTKRIKSKVVFISGEKDKFVDFDFVKGFTHYTVKGMGHSFFEFENVIGELVRKELRKPHVCR